MNSSSPNDPNEAFRVMADVVQRTWCKGFLKHFLVPFSLKWTCSKCNKSVVKVPDSDLSLVDTTFNIRAPRSGSKTLGSLLDFRMAATSDGGRLKTTTAAAATFALAMSPLSVFYTVF